jgi:two-component system response regulator YesN
MSDTTKKRHWAWNRIADLMVSIAEDRRGRFSPAVAKAREYIEMNYADDLSLEGVAREVRVSPFYFSKLFKEECSEGFQDYLTRLRIEAAKKLLDDPERSVKEVSFDIGYQDPNYFSRLFKKETGLTPSEYRER